MDSKSRSKNDVPTLESIRANIAWLKREIHNKTVIGIRNTICSIKGLNGFQTYMKFKSVVMNLDEFFRPDKSSWPMAPIEFFIPHLVDWQAKLRLDKLYEF